MEGIERIERRENDVFAREEGVRYQICGEGKALLNSMS